MLKKMLSLEHNDYFILEMLENAKFEMIVANVIAPLLVFTILRDYVPTQVLGIWVSLTFLAFIFRNQLSHVLLKNVEENSKNKIRTLKLYALSTSLTSILIGASAWFHVFYAVPEIHFFPLLIGLILITAGSIATLASVYVVFFNFILFSIVPFIASLLYQGGYIFNVYASILTLFLFLYLFFGYGIYESRKKAHELNNKFQTIFNKSSDGIALIKDRRLIECNETIVKLFHYKGSVEEFLSSELLLLMPKKQMDGVSSVKKMLRMLRIAQKRSITFEWLHTTQEKKVFWAEITLRPIIINHEKVIHGVWNDISKRKRAEKDLIDLNATLEHKVQQRTRQLEKVKNDFKRLATTDSLTNMHNRYSLMKLFSAEINRARRYKTPLSVIMYDIDNFKKVNDTFGHDVGDDVLVALSDIVKNSLRDNDVVGRYGGEEFFIILPNTELQDANAFAQRLRKKVQERSFYIVKNITISLGLVLLQEKEDVDDVFKRVDDLLYKSKNAGRNRVSF